MNLTETTIGNILKDVKIQSRKQHCVSYDDNTEVVITTYWDPYKLEWTVFLRDALKGYIYMSIDPKIRSEVEKFIKNNKVV